MLCRTQNKEPWGQVNRKNLEFSLSRGSTQFILHVFLPSNSYTSTYPQMFSNQLLTILTFIMIYFYLLIKTFLSQYPSTDNLNWKTLVWNHFRFLLLGSFLQLLCIMTTSFTGSYQSELLKSINSTSPTYLTGYLGVLEYLDIMWL